MNESFTVLSVCSRKICFCALGFSGRLRSEKGKEDFLQEVARVEQFLKDPWLIKARENATIEVKVPKVVVSPAPPPPPPQFPADVSVAVGGGGEEAAAAASAQVKRVALQKQAAAASMVAEDYARRFESGDLEVSCFSLYNLYDLNCLIQVDIICVFSLPSFGNIYICIYMVECMMCEG